LQLEAESFSRGFAAWAIVVRRDEVRAKEHDTGSNGN
jgi:hypothetical protein